MSKKDTLLKRIDEYVKPRKKSDGGYAPVTPEEMGQLSEILARLIELKYESDPDGDLPVHFILTDKTRYEIPLHFPIFHAFKATETKSELELHIEAASRHGYLAKAASDSASRHLVSVQELLRAATTRHSPLELGGLRYLVKPPKAITAASLQSDLATLVREFKDKTPCPGVYQEMMEWHAAIAKKATEKFGLKIHARVCARDGDNLRMYFDVPSLDVSLRIIAANQASPS